MIRNSLNAYLYLLLRQKDINENDDEILKLWMHVLNNKKLLTEETKQKYYLYKNIVKEYNKKYNLEFYYKHSDEYKKKMHERRAIWPIS